MSSETSRDESSEGRDEMSECRTREGPALNQTREGPVLILTISNGAAHTRAAEAVAASIRVERAETETLVVDVGDYMTRAARFTHVTAYLWLVKHAPRVWERIDRYQRRQTRTSPDWYYRRGCRKLFELANHLRPRALVATEVGCCEIAALVKRDLSLDAAPLVAVNLEYEADRALVQTEVDLYCAASERVREELVAHGAPRERVKAWGAPLVSEFGADVRREDAREEVCRRLSLDARLPLVLVMGGGEGLGRLEEITGRLSALEELKPQVVVVTGRNARLRRRCERLARRTGGERMRVLGWTERVPELMRASDLLVSKLGTTFDEALACELPIVALEPPPGSERAQYRLLEEWGTGRAVRSLDELAATVARLLAHTDEIDAMRAKARELRKTDAAARVARWVLEEMRRRGEPRNHTKQREAEQHKGEQQEDEPSRLAAVL